MLRKLTDGTQTVLVEVGTRCILYAPRPPVPVVDVDLDDVPLPPAYEPPPPPSQEVFTTRNYRDEFGRCWRELSLLEDGQRIVVLRELDPFACG